jgi:RNA polymerase sigma-70 factor, ECF subfamily
MEKEPSMGSSRGEAELIERAKRGDEDAFGVLVRMHEQLAFRTAYALLGNATEAEETAQDAFVKAYGALRRFRRGAPFRPWLLRIVGNEARNRLRSRRRRGLLAERVGVELSSRGEVAPAAEAHVLARETDRALLEAIDRLRPAARLVIIGRFFLELTNAEIASALGTRTGAIKMRTARALEQLRRELEEKP